MKHKYKQVLLFQGFLVGFINSINLKLCSAYVTAWMGRQFGAERIQAIMYG